MLKYKRDFIEMLINHNAIKVAKSEDEFYTLKSGRKSPIFFNIGKLSSGSNLVKLQDVYLSTMQSGVHLGLIKDFDYIVGPAYKGIGLAAILALGCQIYYDKNVKYVYDRKEEKNWGENTLVGDMFVGLEEGDEGNFLLLDDVLTDGTAKLDVIRKLCGRKDMRLAGILVAVDRQELTQDGLDAKDWLERELNTNILSIVTFADIWECIKSRLNVDQRRWLEEYYLKFGTKMLK